LRWAGGKSKFVQQIVSRLPILESDATFYEPFLGAAAVFLAYSPNRAVLSDLNPDLIRTFTLVRDRAEFVIAKLQRLWYRDSEDHYYRIRTRFNGGGDDCLQAARFIYLNHTCFNGIYRVNKLGHYNVPYGFKKSPNLPNKKELDSASDLLRRATIMLADYKKAVEGAKRGDVVYLDPPYPPLNGTSYFTHYTKERFGERDQQEVASTANVLRARGCYVIVTNADTLLIRKLYSGWHIAEISRPRWITSSSYKRRVVELIITSHSVGEVA
jgi:DNA adenine methylase